MRLIHLSDLHIGKIVNGYSMLDEQRHVFKQISDYVAVEKPDAVLIAGDVFDRTVPGVEAVCLFDDLLTELASKNVAVMLISGNHDSPERLNYASRLLSDRKLYLCGVYDGKLRSVTLHDIHGAVEFWLLPFIKPAGIRALFPNAEIESYTDAVSFVLDSADIDYSKRNVLLSHQFYKTVGVTPIRSESEIDPIGGLDAVDASILSRFDYVALGHLHGNQNVSENIHYAGSPVKYSFSECRQKKSATLVTLGEKGDVKINELSLTPLHDMREIKGPIDILISKEKVSQGNRDDYLKVILTDEREIIDPLGKLRSVYPNVMALDFENTRINIDQLTNSLSAEEIETLTTYDLFNEFFMECVGAKMTDAQTELVRELLEWSERI